MRVVHRVKDGRLVQVDKHEQPRKKRKRYRNTGTEAERTARARLYYDFVIPAQAHFKDL